MAQNVNRTARLQWKVDTIKNCIYLQCSISVFALFYLGPEHSLRVSSFLLLILPRLPWLEPHLGCNIRPTTHLYALECGLYAYHELFQPLHLHLMVISFMNETKLRFSEKAKKI